MGVVVVVVLLLYSRSLIPCFRKLGRLWVVLHLLLLVLLASSSPSFFSAAQSIPDGPAFPPTVAPTNLSIGELPDALYAEILRATAQITNEVQQNFSYCITDGYVVTAKNSKP
jgi:hypothetical protein